MKIEKRAQIITKKFLRRLKKENCYLEIYFVSGKKMKFLNKKFRGKNKSANILSFGEPENFPHPETSKKILGEIYLNSSAFAKSSADKQLLNTLLAHGLLHLLGFQHQRKSDRIKMEQKERWLTSSRL